MVEWRRPTRSADVGGGPAGLRQDANEVLSGPDAVEQWEFATRLGTSRERARALLHRLSAHATDTRRTGQPG